MESSIDGRQGFLQAFGMCRTNLRIIGLWPSSKDTEFREKISVLIFISTTLTILITVNIGQTIKIFTTWGDLDATSDIISTANLPIAVAVFKMFVFFNYRKDFKMLLTFVKSDWKTPRDQSELENMSSRARLARRISMLCVVLGGGTVNMHLIVRIGQEMGLIPGKSITRLPYVESYFPFNYRPSPIYELVWLGQYTGAALATIAYSGIYCLFVALMLHLCGQFNNLRDQLETVTVQNERDFNQILVRIVERHESLNRCAQIIEAMFNYMFLAEIFACTLQFCLQGFLLVTISSTSDAALPIFKFFFLVLYVMHIGTHLFICCNVVEKFQDENEAFFHAAYNCEWYKLSPKKASLLIMVMHRTDKPVKITAGKFFTFSLRLYAQIFKTSGGYLSMLLAVRDRITNS